MNKTYIMQDYTPGRVRNSFYREEEIGSGTDGKMADRDVLYHYYAERNSDILNRKEVTVL